MLNCAFCDEPCQPTREHVVPEWYNDTPGDTETFSTRAPLTQTKGDLVVKDVCGKCNNGALSSLDGYGKQLYESHFAALLYAGEGATFDFDGTRLIRWLLKLSYNSARAQNADTRVLREYRKVALGEEPIPDRIRCWIHLLSVSYLDEATVSTRPATRDEAAKDEIFEPLWFRIGQFRLPTFPAIFLVQRTVIINSFAFTLLIAPKDMAWPDPVFDEWIDVFQRSHPDAKPVLTGLQSLALKTGKEHAFGSMYFSLANWQSRFGDDPDPFVVQALTAKKGEAPHVMLHVPRDLIEAGDTAPIAFALKDMVSTQEKMASFRQRVAILVDGFDDDPRELWQFPQVREYFRRLFDECPFIMLVSHPDGGLLKVFAACWIYEDDLTGDVERLRMAEFLNKAFIGLNDLSHILALSEEQNRELCMSAAMVLFGELPEGALPSG